MDIIFINTRIMRYVYNEITLQRAHALSACEHVACQQKLCIS